MPSINRIRVNNVKYNFGTQSYDDFSMRMYGRNTLYDLANGGGKSVLMLLLMQNLIPNSTLDDKQPIEKLFRDASNTVIHSLIEWKLDDVDIREGMRYMTTGFAAKRAATTDEERSDGTAQIEYFNYVIFYREYNKNDILNLPLEKGNERISYKALRNYLHDLSRNDKNVLVHIFDRKGEYQRFIAGYGLYESHWEIIRGINKTEGHVRTYFETNYKTTRRVIEDLLIEEIIEKAYVAKTARESDKTESTVSLLMTIQEELKSLAEKKKGIATYDHEQELVQLLIDRIESFMELYGSQQDAARECGRILITLEKERQDREERMSTLNAEVERTEEEIRVARELIEVLRIYTDMEELSRRQELSESVRARISRLDQDIELQDKAYREKSAVSEYLEYKRASEELEALSREKSHITNDADDIYSIVSGIRGRLDSKVAEIDATLSRRSEELSRVEESRAQLSRSIAEGETEIAVIESRRDYITRDIDSQTARQQECADDIDYSLLIDPSGSIRDLNDKHSRLEEEATALADNMANIETELDETGDALSEARSHLISARGIVDNLSERLNEYNNLTDKYSSISSIYTGTDASSTAELEDALRQRQSKGIIRIHEISDQLERMKKREADIRGGRLIAATPGVEKVLDYLFTRHGVSGMSGMDYISALPDSKREEILDSAPGLPFGIVVDDLSIVLSDQSLRELDLDEEVFIYDSTKLGEASVVLGDGVEIARRDKGYFLDPENVEKALRILDMETRSLTEEKRNNEAMLETLREDMDFVIMYREKGYESIEDDYSHAVDELGRLEDDVDRLQKIYNELTDRLQHGVERKTEIASELEQLETSIISLNDLLSIQDKLSEMERARAGLDNDRRDIISRVEELQSSVKDKELSIIELKGEIDAAIREKDKLEYKWTSKYSAYYVEGASSSDPDMSMRELEAAFDRALGQTSESRISLEKEKLLEETLRNTMDRQSRIIEKLGVELSDLIELDSSSELLAAQENVLEAMRAELERLSSSRDELTSELSGINTESARLEGSIEYASQRLSAEYGEEAAHRLETLSDEYRADPSRRVQELSQSLEILKERLRDTSSRLDKASTAARNNDDLIRLADRIVSANDIDTSELEPLDNIDNLSEEFDSLVIRYDKLAKDIDRAKADMLKVKMNVYDTLSSMNIMELAASIRDDVIIPDNRRQAEGLLSRLNEVVDIIRLERDRVEKSLVSMQQLKDNFVDQCVERCLDVRSELDKLPKLSEITMGDTKVQMIHLSIPYVKDEFIKTRMSEYIDSVVEEVDRRDSDSDRQKYLNGSLAMKKLFSVIVTDMSKIRLMLYKRERIQEQSRYLRYEEAVGSTGQSQGIYIQFLISIINYIAGMYSVTDTSRMKTLFIDNPFGAAKDIYIWEPIFKLLEENKCQLIVPARGATPEITGKFDINYVLGQQMTGNRATTVVVNYSSKTKGEELEYKNLDYEQVTFDFV